jgi:rod shape-determining protein MreC
MEFLTHRYRSLTALVLVIGAQLLLLAYQVKTQQDVRLIRVWAVTAVTPVARVLEAVRSNVASFVHDYVVLVDVRQENRRLSAELGKLKLEAQYLRAELATADRARALRIFQSRTPSRTIAARIIGTATAADSKVVFIDRGSTSGVMRGMAVITPDGIVGRISAAYPTASQALLITDPSFAAGVISRKNYVQGTLKGQGHGLCTVDYVQNEEKLEEGEWFFTSGDDRVFPKGLPVGQVRTVRKGKVLKEVILAPSGFSDGLEEVLIVLEGVHQPVPPVKEAAQRQQLLPPPPAASSDSGSPESRSPAVSLSTDADRLRERYRRIGEAQGHVFGEGVPGSPAPDFNLDSAPSQPAPAAVETPAPPEAPAPASGPRQ